MFTLQQIVMLEKIAAAKQPAIVQPFDTPEIIQILGRKETGWSGGDDYNKYTGRTRLRPKRVWDKDKGKWVYPHSSTASYVLQTTEDRERDMAKYSPKFRKLLLRRRLATHMLMRKHGLSVEEYEAYKKAGKFPEGYKPAYDYGGKLYDFTKEEHDAYIDGVSQYLNKFVIPRAMKYSGGDRTKFLEYIGNNWYGSKDAKAQQAYNKSLMQIADKYVPANRKRVVATPTPTPAKAKPAIAPVTKPVATKPVAPKPTPVTGTKYTVTDNDSPWRIWRNRPAHAKSMTWADFSNKFKVANPKAMQIGSEVVLPW